MWWLEYATDLRSAQAWTLPAPAGGGIEMDTQVVELPIPLAELVIPPPAETRPAVEYAAAPIARPVAPAPEQAAAPTAPPDGGLPRLAELVWAGPLVGAMFVGAALEPFVPLLDRVMGIHPPTRR
jgi:hypothetical protein